MDSKLSKVFERFQRHYDAFFAEGKYWQAFAVAVCAVTLLDGMVDLEDLNYRTMSLHWSDLQGEAFHFAREDEDS